MIVLVLLGYSILGIYEFVPLYKQKLWRDFWVNAGLALLSITIAILQCFDLKIPSPSKPTMDLINMLFGE